MRRVAVLTPLLATSTLLLAGCGGPAFQWPDPQPHACGDAGGSGLACTTVWEGLDGPSQVLWHDGWLYVAEQTGRVWRMQDGADGPEETPFLDVSSKVSTCHYEQGLLGLALDGTDLFVTYTEAASCNKRGRWDKGDLLLVRHRLVDGQPEPEGDLLLRVPEPYRNHNGGHIAFGPDGHLYLGVGDGGDHGDPLHTGGDPSDMLGSILRLDVSGTSAVAAPDNPFVGVEGHDARVLHYGLRNPWRFTFDDQGGLWIADVGQDCFEELSYAAPGESGLDFGWSGTEGPAPFPNPECKHTEGGDFGAARPPAWSYGRDQGCSIVGGPILPSASPWTDGGLAGALVAGDFCTGRLWALRAPGNVEDRAGPEGGDAEPAGTDVAAGRVHVAPLLETGLQVTAMALGPDGLYISHWSGSVHRIAPQDGPEPTAQTGAPREAGAATGHGGRR